MMLVFVRLFVEGGCMGMRVTMFLLVLRIFAQTELPTMVRAVSLFVIDLIMLAVMTELFGRLGRTRWVRSMRRMW